MPNLEKPVIKEKKIINSLIVFLLKLEVFLIPLAFLPFSFEFFDFTKQNILWFFTFLAFTLWVFKVIAIDKKLVYKKTPLDMPILIFLAVWGISVIFGSDWFSSLFGYYGRFSDAYLSTVSLALFYFLAVNNLNKNHIAGFLNTFLVSSSLALLTGLLSLTGVLAKLFGNIGGRLAVLNSASFNTVGGASESLALFAAAIFVLAISLYSYNVRGQKKLLASNLKYYIAGIFSLAVLVIINFTIAWVALVASLAFLFVFALYIVYMNREDESMTVEVSIAPALSFFIISLLFLFLFGGSGSLFGVDLAREVTLPMGTARAVSWDSFKANPVFGFGPGNFSYAFSSARPADFNFSRFWQLRFDKAPAYILEIVSTTGLAGVLAYMAVIGVFLFVTFIFLRNIFRISQEESYIAFGFSFMALSLFIMQVLYIANTVLFFMFWLSLALAMINWRFAFSKVFADKKIDLKKYQDVSPILTTILVVVIFMFVFVSFLQAKYYIADINYNNYRLSGNLSSLQTAVKLAPRRLNYHLALARHYINNSRPEIEALSTPGQGSISDEVKANLQNNIQKGIQEAEAAAAIAPNAVMAWELLGSIYRDVRFIAIGSLDPAIRNFERAVELEPTNPILLTELAKLYLDHSQTSEAVDTFNKAIEYKSDYLQAHIGLAKTYDNLGQTDKALLILEEVNRRQPNAEVIYESGRLYYNQNNFSKAIERFRRAIELRPGYANAIYSLGLAYQKTDEDLLALRQFERVLELNPGNEAVKKLVEELRQ